MGVSFLNIFIYLASAFQVIAETDRSLRTKSLTLPKRTQVLRQAKFLARHSFELFQLGYENFQGHAFRLAEI